LARLRRRRRVGLKDGPRASNEVSQHLPVLKEAGLVVDWPAGTRRIYRVDPDGLVALRADLERFWGKALAAFKTAVEQGTEEDR
jgi:DNA-binding transcriptional ArsR family regulator